ncbi:MAG: ATP-binding protein, partial [Cytophagaceae bacterium]
MAITDYHRAIFTYLEAYRREVPEAGLTYSLRQKNKVGRPRNVFLFTGDDKYISIGLYGPISNNNKTRTISFYATYDPVSDRIKTCTLAIVFSDQHLADQEEIYRAIIQQIGPDQFKEYSHNRFEHSYTGADWQANLATYLQQHKPIIDKAIQQAGATETFNIPQEKLEADIIIANQPTPTPVQPVVKPPGKYTWIPFYRELCVKLLHYTTEKLIRVTKQVLKAEKLVGLVDKDADGNKMDLTVIDPYTVLSFIRICADDKRAILFNQLTYQLGLNCSVPADWDGLYTDRNQWIWLFGYADERAPNDIDKLWELYKQVEQDDVSEDLFNQVLAIKKLSKSKLTEGLFSQYPYAYFPLNSKTKEWLKKRKLPHHFSTYAEYISLMDTVEQYDSRPFYELSEEAYKESQPDNELTEPMPLPDSNHPKNIILYGPPGTGKTYGTIDLAVDIVDGQKGKHPANKVRFDQLRKEGQIEFVTFHQNY